MPEYKKCPFCGGEVYKISEMVWETGKDDLLEHPLHALPGIGLPCPLSGLKFRALKWQQRPGEPVDATWYEKSHLPPSKTEFDYSSMPDKEIEKSISEMRGPCPATIPPYDLFGENWKCVAGFWSPVHWVSNPMNWVTLLLEMPVEYRIKAVAADNVGRAVCEQYLIWKEESK